MQNGVQQLLHLQQQQAADLCSSSSPFSDLQIIYKKYSINIYIYIQLKLIDFELTISGGWSYILLLSNIIL